MFAPEAESIVGVPNISNIDIIWKEFSLPFPHYFNSTDFSTTVTIITSTTTTNRTDTISCKPEG